MLYMLQFEQALGQGKHGRAQYYLGFCEDWRLNERIAEHRAGHGAAITRACVERGIEIKLVAVYPCGSRGDERRFKNWKNHRRVIDSWCKQDERNRITQETVF
jgi:predicted GIY-YIG superfamily endonuclease